MFRSFITFTCCAFIVSTVLVSNVYAEACTYSEAMMALKSGNVVRGQVLMKMAARDGDPRAAAFVATYAENLDQSAKSGKALQDNLIQLSASTNAPATVQHTVVRQITTKNVN